MAYINYGQGTVGGKQVGELCADVQSVEARFVNLGGWISAIDSVGASALETNTDFSVGTGEHAAFRDTFLQIAADYAAFMTANREKIARLARGA